LQRLPKFDPQVAHYNVFAKTVIERCVASIIHHRKAKRRSCCRNGGSLNSIIHDSEGNKVELQAILVDDQNKSHTGQDAASEEERLGLGHDLVEVIADLPPRLREICERLKYYSTARVARNMDIRRDEIYELIGRIRQRFAKSDLHNYL
jgi:RNA polymerase sigma-70 factor (ECF subfamily)